MKFLLLALLLFSPWCFGQVKHGIGEMLPPALQKEFELYKSFSANQWDFLVIELAKPDLDFVKNLCDEVIPFTESRSCDSMGSMAEVEQWNQGVFLRRGPPQLKEISTSKNQILAQASLPIPRELLQVFRSDPLGHHREFQELGESLLPEHVQVEEGFLRIKDSLFYVIPLRLSSKGKNSLTSLQSQLSKVCEEGGQCKSVLGIGPSFGEMENKNRVQEDLKNVSVTGSLLLALLAILLVVLKRYKVLIIVLPVISGMALATLVTAMFFDGIHGLTLAFGAGLVGLAFDYGFHGFVGAENKKVWATNSVGLVTTLAVLFVLYWSDIPLIKEIMFYATNGLIFSFLILKAVHEKYPKIFVVLPLALRLQPFRGGYILLGLSFLLIGFFLNSQNIDLKLKQFDFSTPETKELTKKWLGNRFESVPLYKLYSVTDTGPIEQDHEWSKRQNIVHRSVLDLLPPLHVQESHLEAWKTWACEPQGRSAWLKSLTSNEMVFFQPFLKISSCAKLQKMRAISFSDGSQISYVKPLVANNFALGQWFPRTKSESQLIQKEVSGAKSFLQLMERFPRILGKELQWMFPVSMVLVLFILLLYFKSIWLSLGALIPFVMGLGFILGVHWALGLSISFISVIGIIMVYGLSVDYGVFVVDHYRNKDESHGIWSALLFCALTSGLGFIPLMSAQHPVLFHLGSALVFGTLGTLLGAYFVVPQWVSRR